MTPAIRLLETRNVPHTVHRYEVADDADVTYGETVAATLGVAASRVFKTLVAETRDGELVVGIVPAQAPAVAPNNSRNQQTPESTSKGAPLRAERSCPCCSCRRTD